MCKSVAGASTLAAQHLRDLFTEAARDACSVRCCAVGFETGSCDVRLYCLTGNVCVRVVGGCAWGGGVPTDTAASKLTTRYQATGLTPAPSEA